MSACRAVTGAQIFEIGRPDKQRKADALADKIREVLAGKEEVRVTCPIATAHNRRRLAGMGKLKIGWTKVRIEALEKRPFQCFKCLRKGHVWA